MVNVIAEDLQLNFGKRQLFSVAHLQLSQGQTIHLKGDNGSGKTSLMKLLAGLIKPSAGKISAHGFAPSPWWHIQSLLGKAIYLHQHPYLFDGSVEYNLNYPHPFSELSAKELKQRTAMAIDMAGLEHLRTQAASSLSGGERQRLALARVWIIQPKLLMLDEPTSNMDARSQELMLTMIKSLQQTGTGLLLSSHHNCQLTNLCDHAWRIRQGKIFETPQIAIFETPQIELLSTPTSASAPQRLAPTTNSQDTHYAIAN